MTQPATKPQPIAKEGHHYTIHVFPQVKKFMLKNFAHQNGVFKSEEWSTLGSLVTLCLIDKEKWRDGHYNNDYLKENTTKAITIILSPRQAKMSPRVYKLQRINIEINTLFKEHMETWIKSQYKLGVPAYQACKSFLEYYGLDPDGKEYSIDNAYKAWQRSQEKKDKSKKILDR